MLNKQFRKRLPWLLLSAVFLAVFVDFVWWWASLSYSFSTAVCDPTGSQQDCPRYNPLFAFAVSWAYDLNYWGAMVTAIATGFIAWFTFSLRDATKEQGRLTQEAIKLARDEFNAAHRPEIIIHNMEHAKVTGTSFVGANITYVNKGTAPAKNATISGKIELIEGRPLPGTNFPELEKVPLVIAGKIYKLGIPSKVDWSVRQLKAESIVMWQSQAPIPRESTASAK